MAYVWGVDSASPANSSLLQCVITNFGKPLYWGRYLSTVPGAADGLTTQEISFLHGQNVKILPIYNDFRQAVGYENGKNAARAAAGHAARLGIARGTFLFANIERFFKVDEAWIRGWVDTIRTSGYKSGMYHDPIHGPFSAAYCRAVSKDSRVKTESVLWSAEPERTVTGPQNAPAYAPYSPKCGGNVWGWQYGRDSKTCPIDTNLIDTRLYGQLF
ncbi:glycoside hydrolase domain-containing protein [Marinicrinis lubricantis]